MKKRLATLTLLAFALTLFSAMPSFAAEKSAAEMAALENGKFLSENRIDQSYDLPTAADMERNAFFDETIAKINEAYNAYYADRITIDELQEIEDACYFALYPEEANNPMASMATNPERRAAVEESKRLINLLPNSSKGTLAIGDGQNVWLGMPYEAQLNNWYCGPATAVNIVNGYNGYAKITQYQAATLLGTTTSGTNFGTNWLNVLNPTYMGKNYQVFYGSPGWAVSMANATISTLFNGRGVALNLYMHSGTTYLIGYDGLMGTVGHYVVAYGFNSTNPSRREVRYLDPNYNNSLAWGAHAVSFQDMALATQDRGIIY